MTTQTDTPITDRIAGMDLSANTIIRHMRDLERDRAELIALLERRFETGYSDAELVGELSSERWERDARAALAQVQP